MYFSLSLHLNEWWDSLSIIWAIIYTSEGAGDSFHTTCLRLRILQRIFYNIYFAS